MADDREGDILPDEAVPDGALPPGRERALIRHIPYFVTVVQEGNFCRAADRLAMSQSALTRRIQSLEDELGVSLFARNHRSARLTDAGAAFYEDAEAVLEAMRLSILRARKVMRGEAGALNVAMTDGGLQTPAVAETFRVFKALYPDVEISLHSIYSKIQVEKLRNDDIDIGLLYDFAIEELDKDPLEFLPIHSAMLHLVMNEHHPLAGRKSLRIADLAKEHFVWPSRPGIRPLGERLMAEFGASGVTPNIAVEGSSAQTVIDMALANLAMGFARRTTHLPEGLVMIPVEDVTVAITAYAVWLRENEKPALSTFLDVLRDRVRVWQ